MKKILFFMLAAVLLTACGDDEDAKAPVVQTIDFADYSTAVGMSYTQMLSTYGEPAMAFEGFYSYDLQDGKTESLTMIANTDNNKVYMVMQILAENAYKFEDIYDYFASKYNMYTYHKAGFEEEDGETYETEATATFGNADKEEDATLLIVVSGDGSVSYVDPTNIPAQPEPGDADFSNVAPEDVAAMFLGRSWDDVEEEYGDCIQEFNGYLMINVSDNAYYTCIFFTVEDGIVTEVKLMFDDLEDAEVIAYFEGLGFTAIDCGEEDGLHSYFFTNAATGQIFTYTNPIATFVYVDPDAEEYPTDGED